MTLQVLHPVVKQSLPINTSGLTGDQTADRALSYIQGLKGGRLVGIAATGLALAAAAVKPIGVLLLDAAGNDNENVPALASKLAGVASGSGTVAITDQLKSGETFAAGDLLYQGTGADAGLFTKTAGAGTYDAAPYAIALDAASPTSPSLKFMIL